MKHELDKNEQDALDTIKRDKGKKWFRPQDLSIFRPAHLCRHLKDKGLLNHRMDGTQNMYQLK